MTEMLMPNKRYMGYQLAIGERFGRLVIQSECERANSGYKKYRKNWLCLCDCGNTKIAVSGALVNGKVVSCGCLMRENRKKGRTHQSMRKPGAGLNSYINSVRTSAKRREIHIDLTNEEIAMISSGNCHYCNCQPSLQTKSSSGYVVYTRNGIDRLNPAIGYILSNCVSCCKMCNFMKYTLTKEQFLTQIRKIYNHVGP